ncbi:MAG: hypothetical protein AAF655_18190, partial [Bacteroidota bacterium]
YVLGFLSYGLKYLFGLENTTNNFISLVPFLLIIFSRFLVVTATGLKREYRIVPYSKLLALVLLHFLLTLIARVRADLYGLPGSTLLFGLSSFAVYFIPFVATLIMLGYAKKYHWKGHTPLQLLTTSLGVLFLANVIGYFMGLKPPGHYFEGRINLPVIGGIYPGANMTALVFLIAFGYLRFAPNLFLKDIKYSRYATKGIMVLILFALSLYVSIGANSRITILLILFIMVLSIKSSWLLNKKLFFVSFFTLPILLNFGYVLYFVLSLPIFESLLQRVDYQDIITFHGRSYLWERLFEWLFYGGEGIIFGKGFKGYYFLDLISDIGGTWYGGSNKSHFIHLHSSFGELIIAQGIIGFIVYAMVIKSIFSYLKSAFSASVDTRILSLLFLFLLFLFQIDYFVFQDGLGSIIMGCFAAIAIIQPIHPDQRLI